MAELRYVRCRHCKRILRRWKKSTNPNHPWDIAPNHTRYGCETTCSGAHKFADVVRPTKEELANA